MRAHNALRSLLHTSAPGLRASIQERIAEANVGVVADRKQGAAEEVQRAKANHANHLANVAAKRAGIAKKAKEEALASAEKCLRERQIQKDIKPMRPQLQSPEVLDARRQTRLNSSGMSNSRYAALTNRKNNVVAPELEAKMQNTLKTQAQRLGATHRPSQTHFTPDRLSRLRSSGMSPERHAELAAKRLNRR